MSTKMVDQVKKLVTERDQHRRELAGMNELIVQKTARINYLEGGIQSLLDIMDEEDKNELEKYYQEIQNPSIPDDSNK